MSIGPNRDSALSVTCPTCHARPGRKCRGDLPPIEVETHLTRMLTSLKKAREEEEKARSARDFRPMATALSTDCKTCGGTGGISATSPGEEEKGYVTPCPDCHPANETSAAMEKK